MSNLTYRRMAKNIGKRYLLKHGGVLIGGADTLVKAEELKEKLKDILINADGIVIEENRDA